jgi:NTP pyrophosphatase (non-canonical NTP hydrolase)
VSVEIKKGKFDELRQNVINELNRRKNRYVTGNWKIPSTLSTTGEFIGEEYPELVDAIL